MKVPSTRKCGRRKALPLDPVTSTLLSCRLDCTSVTNVVSPNGAALNCRSVADAATTVLVARSSSGAPSVVALPVKVTGKGPPVEYVAGSAASVTDVTVPELLSSREGLGTSPKNLASRRLYVIGPASLRSGRASKMKTTRV
jgi:hypothetical protein